MSTIDQQVLADLVEATGGGDWLRQLLTKFLDHTAGQVRTLETSIDADDFVLVAETAHSAKSSSKTVGATQLGDAFAAVEHAAKAGDSEGVSRTYQRVTGEFARAKAAMQDYLDTL